MNPLYTEFVRLALGAGLSLSATLLLWLAWHLQANHRDLDLSLHGPHNPRTARQRARYRLRQLAR